MRFERSVGAQVFMDHMSRGSSALVAIEHAAEAHEGQCAQLVAVGETLSSDARTSQAAINQVLDAFGTTAAENKSKNSNWLSRVLWTIGLG